MSYHFIHQLRRSSTQYGIDYFDRRRFGPSIEIRSRFLRTVRGAGTMPAWQQAVSQAVSPLADQTPGPMACGQHLIRIDLPTLLSSKLNQGTCQVMSKVIYTRQEGY